MNRNVPLVEVVQLGGAQAGWSEEEASDVSQHLHDKHRVPRAYQTVHSYSYKHIHNPRNIRAGIFGVNFSLSHCARKNLIVLQIIPFRNTCLRHPAERLP
jgi:hypothetical protein